MLKATVVLEPTEIMVTFIMFRSQWTEVSRLMDMASYSTTINSQKL